MKEAKFYPFKFFRTGKKRRGEKCKMGDKDKDKKVTLRIAETNPKFVGRGTCAIGCKGYG